MADYMEITIIIATSNANKAREFADLLPGVRVLPMPGGIELPEETGSTFEENARLKAESVLWQLRAGPESATVAGPGVWVMADDSGLEVEALGGAPGIHSARYGGEGATDTGNVDKLLAELKGKSDRRARFVCVLVCVSASNGELVARGDFEGSIAEAPRGRSGFGYDPVFIPANKKLTVSQIPAEEKNRISHRARAAHSLLAQLRGG
ncbi:MAG: RdgB/HAM1 family non-canonical purine NTP pyrophosphatase [Actinobacteria bacterium]|nr:RdgB/HAM1 family non-canonical purine NTP pyrophosphatase [Actinomycetota bacterium]MCL5882739.1 RdgB/HAM1 family non-canonical purine NTP pyrophosphatase [Actinomycetota bacterium]